MIVSIPLVENQNWTESAFSIPPRFELAENVLPARGGFRTAHAVGSPIAEFSDDELDQASANNDPTKAFWAFVHPQMGHLTTDLTGSEHDHMGVAFAETNDVTSARLWYRDPEITTGNAAFFQYSAAFAYAGAERSIFWDFCSFGNRIVATDYVHPVQTIDTSSVANWADLFTSTEKPQCRFVGTVRNQLVCANIDNTITGGGPGNAEFPDMVWWSGVDDALDMDPDVTTQSDFQQLLDVPGVITGFQGGEYGLVFKANGIWRMEFVGSPLIYTFELISHTYGTLFPRSVVRVGNDTYFWGYGGVYVIRSGQFVEPVGANDEIRGWLYDFHTEGYDQDSAFITDNQGNLGQQVHGAYDPASDCIFWMYPSQADTDASDRDILVYNVSDSRMSVIAGSDLDAGTPTRETVGLTQIPVTTFGTDTIPIQGAGIGIVQWDSTAGATRLHVERMTSATNLTGTFRTNVFTLKDDGRKFKINRVRPVFALTGSLADPGSAAAHFNYYSSSNSVLIHFSNRPDFSVGNVQSETVTMDNIDGDGWMPFRQTRGEFFRITLTLATAHGIRTLRALQLDLQEVGTYGG